MENTIYRIWFNDGSDVLFCERELAKKANDFGFSVEDLQSDQEAALLDDDGSQIGGVQVL